MTTRSKNSADDPGEARSRHAELVSEIARHDELYYSKQSPVIADVEYDELLRELLELEEAFPVLVSPDSPTQRVSGRPVRSLESVAHRRPMLSLSNTYGREDVMDWFASVTDFLGDSAAEALFNIEPKLDGVALELVYENGVLVRAITRGDGKVGDDVTHTVRTIQDIPDRLSGDAAPSLLEVRGEVVMTHENFQRVNAMRDKAGEEQFVNPRNLTSGTLKMLDPRIAATRPLDFMAYGLGETDGFETTGHSDALRALERLGLRTAGDLACRGTLDEVLAHHDALLERRGELPFDVDGSVIKVDDYALQQRLGERSRSPRWAIAFKFPAQTATSVVREIQVQVGRTGALTPKAVIEPTYVGGVTIEHVTLHNKDEIERLGIKVGDRVLLERAGDVIPKILSVTESGEGAPFFMPTRCPSCDTIVIDDPGEVVVRCPNRSCPAVLARRVEHFVSRAALDVDGMGSKLVAQLVEEKVLTSLGDLYALTGEQLMKLPRMGEVSARNVLAGLEVSKTRPFARVLFGLGIRHVGQHVAEVVANHWRDFGALREVKFEQLEDVNEIGPTVAGSLMSWLSDEVEQEQIDRMLDAGLAPAMSSPPATGEGILAGRSFLFTGALEQMSRREANEMVKAAGGRLVSGVSKNLDVLVVGKKPGSKLKKAEALGVEVMEENAFLRLLRPFETS